MALRKNLDKSNWSLILRDQTVEGEGKKKKKRREEEREIKKVWILVWISMIFGMDFTWKARILWFCMEF